MTDNTEISDIEQIQEEGTDTPIQEETLNNEPVIEELEPVPNPWDDAPTDVYFYEKIYDDGHLGSFTQSAELAYKSGWDIEHNYIPIEDTQQSDINGWTYKKELCPMKTEEDHLRDQYRIEITQLKKQLSDTDSPWSFTLRPAGTTGGSGRPWSNTPGGLSSGRSIFRKWRYMTASGISTQKSFTARRQCRHLRSEYGGSRKCGRNATSS